MGYVSEWRVCISEYCIDFTDVNTRFGIDDDGLKGGRRPSKRNQKSSFMTF